MKTMIKVLLGLVAACALLAGGFAAGTFITQTRAANAPAKQPNQQTFTFQPQAQSTASLQGQVQTSANSQPLQTTAFPQTTPLPIPPQDQWGSGWWMMDPNSTTQQGQQGWGMGGWNNGGSRGQGQQCCGMYGGMMDGYGQQNNPNYYSTPAAPGNSPAYPTPSAPVSFKAEVQPIFAERCVSCHGGTSGLYLGTYENILKGGNNGAVVIPGDVYNSRLAYYVYSSYMPYRATPLSSVEIQTILDWIASGAPNN